MLLDDRPKPISNLQSPHREPRTDTLVGSERDQPASRREKAKWELVSR
jgi:hypothetical protein